MEIVSWLFKKFQKPCVFELYYLSNTFQKRNIFLSASRLSEKRARNKLQHAFCIDRIIRAIINDETYND